MIEDDRVTVNDDGVSAGKILGGIAVGTVILVFWLAFAPAVINPAKPKATTAPQKSGVQPAPLHEQTEEVVKTVAPLESRKEYIISTRNIGNKGAPIYYKEFLKNPQKFEGQRINFPGKIMTIEESNGVTVIQLQVTEKFDTVIVSYEGSVPVYEGDFVNVYGEGAGTIDGTNRMGAAMTWPAVKAKYIVKRKSAEE